MEDERENELKESRKTQKCSEAEKELKEKLYLVAYRNILHEVQELYIDRKIKKLLKENKILKERLAKFKKSYKKLPS